MDREVRFADEGAEAAECRATRLLRPADEGVVVASRSLTRSESGAYAGATAPASDLVRQAQLLKIVSLLPRFFVAVTRTRFATQTNVRWTQNQKLPNKAPEPTPLAVTPRAIAFRFSIARPAGARGAPASVVAHL